MAPDALGQLEVWFVCGSQDMYGAETLRQVEAHAAEIAAAPRRRSRRSRCAWCQEAVATTPESIRAVLRRGEREPDAASA